MMVYIGEGSTSKSTVINLVDVVVKLNAFPALAGLNLQISEGEICFIKGVNGAGKTTLLKLLAGLLKPERGSGTVFDFDLNNYSHRSQLRRVSGLFMTSDILYNDLSVAENVHFWSKINKSDVDDCFSLLDVLFDSPALVDNRVSTLSSGQKKRAAIAIFISRKPSLWLLDEPYQSLDSSGKDFIDSAIRVAQSLGSTVLFTSHLHDRATSVATKVLRLEAGRIASEQSEDILGA